MGLKNTKTYFNKHWQISFQNDCTIFYFHQLYIKYTKCIYYNKVAFLKTNFPLIDGLVPIVQLSTTLLIAHCMTQFSNFCLLMNMVRRFLSCNFYSSGHATEHVFIYIYAFRHYPCELVYVYSFSIVSLFLFHWVT